MIQFEIFDQTAAKAISVMSKRFRAGHAVDLQDLAMRYTFDSTTTFLFGLDINELSEALPYPYFVEASDHESSTGSESLNRKFARAFVDAQKAAIPRIIQGALWPLREIKTNLVAGPMKVVDEYLYRVFDNSVNTAGELELIDEDKQTLLDQMSKQTDGKLPVDSSKRGEITGVIDREIWKDEIVNLFVAARDTVCSINSLESIF